MEERKLTKEDIDKVRDIEGFPIAKDEDIIALSRPPYYTACPNPFIADFIAEHGTPYDEATDDYHREPYAADVSEGKTDDMYNLHTYHTKVPPKAILQYILHYTKPNDIVLDAFAGTGMTGVACSLASTDSPLTRAKLCSAKGIEWGKRFSILNDLSPAASYISSVYNLNCRVNVLSEGTRILNSLDSKFGWAYKTKHIINGKVQTSTGGKPVMGTINYVVWSDVVVCPSCGKESVFATIGMDEETGIRNSKNIICPYCGAQDNAASYTRAEISVYDDILGKVVSQIKEVPIIICYSVGGRKFEKSPDSDDYVILERISNMKLPSNVPFVIIPDGANTNQPKRSHRVEYIHQLYEKRSLIAFSILWEQVNAITDNAVKSVLLFWLQSVSVGFTKTNRYFASSYSQVNRYLKGTLYISPIRAEVSPWYALGGKLKKMSKLLPNPNCCITNGSATQMNIPDNSIDYIFIDPPFGANIMYSELNIIWESWLKIMTNNDDEAIINEFQNKGANDYSRLMIDSLRELFRVLKPGHWMTVEFHNSKNQIWNILQNAIGIAGFFIADIRLLDKKQQTMKQYSTSGSVDKDLVISAYKPTDSFVNKVTDSIGDVESAWIYTSKRLSVIPMPDDSDNDGKIERLNERQDYLLFDRMVAFHIMNGIPVPMDAHTFYAGLRERFIQRDGMFFLSDQVNEYDERRAKMGLQDQQMSLYISDEKSAIAWLLNQLARQRQTYSEIQPKYLQELHQIKFERMPELLDMLKENFLQDGEGKWYVPNLSDKADLEKLRRKRLLKDFYDIYAKGTGRIRNARTEAIRVGFDECWKERNYSLIVKVGCRLPETVLQEDPALLMYYDNAANRM